MENITASLYKDGYAIVQRVLASEEVELVRNDLNAIWREEDQDHIRPSRLLRSPRLALIPYATPAVTALKSAYEGGYVMMPNFTARINAFPDWHFDVGFLNEDVTGSSFLFLQCAVYLQNSHHLYGGGLDIVAGSHRCCNDGVASLVDVCRRKVSLQTNAGDMVVWNGRLLHRATPAICRGPTERMVITWTTAALDAPYRAFAQQLRSRVVESVGGFEVMSKRYQDTVALRYPDHFPTAVVAAIESAGIRFASCLSAASPEESDVPVSSRSQREDDQ